MDSPLHFRGRVQRSANLIPGPQAKRELPLSRPEVQSHTVSDTERAITIAVATALLVDAIERKRRLTERLESLLKAWERC